MAETFYWGVEVMKALISLWGDDNIRGILEGKTKKNQLAYQQIANSTRFLEGAIVRVNSHNASRQMTFLQNPLE